MPSSSTTIHDHTIGINCHENQHLIQLVIQHVTLHENLISYNKIVHRLLSVLQLVPVTAESDNIIVNIAPPLFSSNKINVMHAINITPHDFEQVVPQLLSIDVLYQNPLWYLQHPVDY